MSGLQKTFSSLAQNIGSFLNIRQVGRVRTASKPLTQMYADILTRKQIQRIKQLEQTINLVKDILSFGRWEKIARINSRRKRAPISKRGKMVIEERYEIQNELNAILWKQFITILKETNNNQTQDDNMAKELISRINLFLKTDKLKKDKNITIKQTYSSDSNGNNWLLFLLFIQNYFGTDRQFDNRLKQKWNKFLEYYTDITTDFNPDDINNYLDINYVVKYADRKINEQTL